MSADQDGEREVLAGRRHRRWRARSTVTKVVTEVRRVRERVALMARFMTSSTSPRRDLQGLADAVEDDDGVVDRVTGDGEDGADVDEREFAADEDDDARWR